MSLRFESTLIAELKDPSLGPKLIREVLDQASDQRDMDAHEEALITLGLAIAEAGALSLDATALDWAHQQDPAGIEAAALLVTGIWRHPDGMPSSSAAVERAASLGARVSTDEDARYHLALLLIEGLAAGASGTDREALRSTLDALVRVGFEDPELSAALFSRMRAVDATR